MKNKIVVSILVCLVSLNTLAQDKKPVDLNISDLGFSESDLATSPEAQKLLEERRYYLKQHQIWGLVSAGAMALTVFSGGEGSLPPEHAFFAGLAVTAYAAAGYTAWKAPEVKGQTYSGGSGWHKRLAWIHGPGMILAPILGYMAAKKIDKDEKLDGPEKYHKDVAGITAVALILSAAVVSFEF